LLALTSAVNTDDLDPFVRQTVRQYIDFMSRPSIGAMTDPILVECAIGINQLITELSPGSTTTAIELWAAFIDRFPDHTKALDDRYADRSNYSAKAWFGAKVQQMAASRNLIEETGEWRKVDPTWGFPKVRVYRRITD
jgi:hypothetical protein